MPFLFEAWVDAWLSSWKYRDVIAWAEETAEKRRQELWVIFDRVRGSLKERALLTQADLYSRLAAHVAASRRAPYDFVVVDEAQDLSVPQLRFLAALGAGRSDALFFTGDLGQRIFQLPFSWRALGVDIRGRSETLRINYRTSHRPVPMDRLLGNRGRTGSSRSARGRSRCSMDLRHGAGSGVSAEASLVNGWPGVSDGLLAGEIKSSSGRTGKSQGRVAPQKRRVACGPR
jgi:hypothetical protein